MDVNYQDIEKVNCIFCHNSQFDEKYFKNGFSIVQCTKCKLIMTNPRLTAQAITNLYADDYFNGKGFDTSINYTKDRVEANSNIRNLSDWDISSIKEMLKNGINIKMLEIGGGNGLFLIRAKKVGINVEGLELSLYGSELIKSLGIPVQNVTIEEYQGMHESFDVIVMREVIEHLLNPIVVLQKIFMLLKPGGVLFVTTGNYDCIERKLKGKNWFYFMPEGHLYYFTPKTLKNILKKTGFNKIYVTNQGDLLMNLLLKFGILDTDHYIPKSPLKYLMFHLIRFINHFISSGMRCYAIK